MKNPWTKKNPFLSMWLSGANTLAGAARGHAQAEAKRQTTRMMTKATKEMQALYGGAPAPRPARKKKKR